jgi:hypothetical protein
MTKADASTRRMCFRVVGTIWQDAFPAGSAPADGSAIAVDGTTYLVARLSRAADGLSLTCDLAVV